MDDTDILGVIPEQITTEINTNLEREVTKLVIRVTTKEVGFPGLFYQRSWQTVGRDVITTLKSFLRSVVFISTINQRHMTLIPNIPSPTRTSDCRRISLCNSFIEVNPRCC